MLNDFCYIITFERKIVSVNKENYAGLPFSDILESQMYYAGDNRLISDKIQSQGYTVSMRSLQQYRASERVPSIQKAQLILEALGIQMTNEQIKESLVLEREKQVEMKIDDNIIEKHVILYEHEFKHVANGETGFVSDIIEQRIQQLYPNQKRGFSSYVRDLIEADIVENVIKK